MADILIKTENNNKVVEIKNETPFVSKGDNTHPVYFDSTGQAQPITQQIGNVAGLSKTDVSQWGANKLIQLKDGNDNVYIETPVIAKAGATVDITQYIFGTNYYTCENDGYLNIVEDAEPNTADCALVQVMDKNNVQIGNIYFFPKHRYEINSLFVKKGMKLSVSTVSTGIFVRFFNLINQ